MVEARIAARYQPTPPQCNRRDEEKYSDYRARVERDGEKANKTSGNRWTNEEMAVLEQLIDEEATQLRICAALPVRTWEAL